MNTIAAPINKRPTLNALALAAATELDARVSGGSAVESTRALAVELRRLFPGQRPNLPPETIGLVCGVVQTWAGSTEPGGYDRSTKAAQKIAELLEKPRLSRAQIKQLLHFCVSLYYATQSKPVIHDIPEDHEGFLSMC